MKITTDFKYWNKHAMKVNGEHYDAIMLSGGYLTGENTYQLRFIKIEVK